jgi:hypothetical protein
VTVSNQDDRGTIRTRSGTWEWTLKTFSPWPKSSPVSRRLGFKDPANVVNTMSVRLEAEVEVFSERSVRRLSLGPLSRRFEDCAGNVWIAHPVGERRAGAGEPVRQVSLRSLEHPSRIMDLPPGRTLGDLKSAELAELV